MREINGECAVTFTNARTAWLFNPPSAPHMGGSWERLVRSVKTAMKAIADHPHHPCDEVLETIALEAESMVNSRPLTYIPLETEQQEALTPNHFLLYGPDGIKQPAQQFRYEGAALRDSWKRAQYLVDQFWKRWIKEYVPTITRRTKWFLPVKPLEPGDLVVVIDDSRRNGWIRGRVVEVVKGVDGQVRRALIQVREGLMWRPTVKLALLEVQDRRTTRAGECSQHFRTEPIAARDCSMTEVQSVLSEK
ncbi:uncharacterized protein LOC129719981 [Wyeomyia smithii]|uniref:uncharacterized protein LOC129719981 n=1 Tax=Wyeomyia smithii TaxID=174621 RepID=UPI002467D710|nr:uncharacterized protein LOC129719981 [Wyeomyia smithii]